MITYSFAQVAQVNADQAVTVRCPKCHRFLANMRLAAGMVDVRCTRCKVLFRWDTATGTLMVLPGHPRETGV